MLTYITGHVCKLSKNLFLTNEKGWLEIEQLILKGFMDKLKHTHTRPWMDAYTVEDTGREGWALRERSLFVKNSLCTSKNQELQWVWGWLRLCYWPQGARGVMLVFVVKGGGSYYLLSY